MEVAEPSRPDVGQKSADDSSVKGTVAKEGDGATAQDPNGDLFAPDESFEPLEDLDDEEYSLPPVEAAATLEEILEEADEEDFAEEDEEEDEELGNPLAGSLNREGGLDGLNGSGSVVGSHLDAQSILSAGSGGSRSRGSRSTRRSAAGAHGRKGRKKDDAHGKIMRHVILKGISSQLVSACERVDAGLPTCLSASDLIAVGTAHARVLVFDSAQVLRFSLGGSHLLAANGAISALSFSPDCSRLLVGFAKGQLAEFDVASSGKLVQTLDEVHPIGAAITHARFTDDPSIALIADSGGSVFEIVFRKKLPGLRGYTSRCIFSGSRGEVCTLEPLSLTQHPGHFLGGLNIVALATISKVLVLTLRPSMRVLFSTQLSGSTDSLPVLSWQFVIVKTSSRNKVVDPVLAFGRHRTVFFYQVSEGLSDRPCFIPLQRLVLDYTMLAMAWLNTRCLAVVDSAEVFHLHDVKNQEELETVDLSDACLVYGSSFFKGLATGGNVSKAMSKAGEKAVYGSFATFTDQMLILGRQSFHVLVIRTWTERLDNLVKAGEHARALDLAREFLDDQGKTLVGLKGPKERRRISIATKLLSLIELHLKACVTVNFPAEGGIHELAEHFGANVPPAVKACMAIKRKDVLFREVWEAFSEDPFAKAAFLEALEPYLLSDQLRNMPVAVCQEFVKHYEAVGKFKELEACITHLNVTSLDIHQVMNLCWQHNLHEAVIYIHNNGMMDYVSPAEELLTQLRSALDSADGKLSHEQFEMGNKLLVYISCCLAGRAFPHGDIPKDRVAQVKYDVYTCLTALHTKRASESETPYPHLRTLLRFDCQGLLNVIEIAFEEPEFRTDTGQCQKQRLVDILLQIMVKQGAEGRSGEFSPTQVGHLFTFLARRVAAGDRSLQVSRDLFDKVLDVLTETKDATKSHLEERQQALLEMLSQGKGVVEHFDRTRLLERAKAAGFTRILERLHEDAGDVDLILRCHLEDGLQEGKMQAFLFAQRVLASEDRRYDEAAKGKVEKSVIADIVPLTKLSPDKTANLVFNSMKSYLQLVLTKLENSKDAELFYSFLTCAYSLQTQTSPVKEADKGEENHLHQDPLASEETFETYINLMCLQEPERVSSTLRGTKHSYNTKRMLSIVKKYDNVDAEAHLLERDGQIKEAFALLRQKLEKKLADVGGNEAANEDLAWSRTEAEIIGIVQLLQRARNTLPEDRQCMWFALLDLLLEKQEAARDKETTSRLKESVRHVVNSTLGHVPLRAALERVLKHPAYQGDRVSFGEIRAFLTELLAMYHYEETLLKSTVQLVQADLHEQVLNRHRQARKGLMVSDPIRCHLCSLHLAERGGRAIVFHCGHSFHAIPCLANAGCVSVNDMGEEEWTCYKCMIKDNRGVEIDATSIKPQETQTASQMDPDELDSIVNRHVVEAKATADALKTVGSPLATLDGMSSEVFIRRDDFVMDESSVSVFARQGFDLKLWPGPNPD